DLWDGAGAQPHENRSRSCIVTPGKRTSAAEPSSGAPPSPSVLLVALPAVAPSHLRALPGRGPHQRLVVVKLRAPALDAGLDRETLHLALGPYQRLGVVQGNPPGLNTSLHLHSHPPFW